MLIWEWVLERNTYVRRAAIIMRYNTTEGIIYNKDSNFVEG
jgi:hypothetical protein